MFEVEVATVDPYAKVWVATVGPNATVWVVTVGPNATVDVATVGPTATVEVAALHPERHRATLRTVCTVEGEPVLEGEAYVSIPPRQKPNRDAA